MSLASALHQPNRQVPLHSYWIERTHILGVLGLRNRIFLQIERVDGHGTAPVLFIVDSGASYSIVSLELAQSRLIPVPPPQAEIDLPMQTARGTAPVRVRPGRIRCWWNDSLQGYPFDWPVLFQVDAPRGLPSILGLGGIVKTCRWTFDGRGTPDSPHGSLTLEDTR